MRAFAYIAACALSAAPALAADPARPTLAEAMAGATAMAAVGNYLFVTQSDTTWVCAIDVSAKHFAALVESDDVVAEQTVPGALCVPATHFKNLAE